MDGVESKTTARLCPEDMELMHSVNKLGDVMNVNYYTTTTNTRF
jgi:hypothetical protein